jgi:hypothetical protein
MSAYIQNPLLQDIISLRLRMYLNMQTVPRSKHTPSPLYKAELIEVAPFSPLSEFFVMNSGTNGQEQHLER